MGYRNLSNERVGQVRKNNFGSFMEVVEYNGAYDVWVKFEQGTPLKVQWDNFCKGKVKNPYDRTAFGIGYIGEGQYKPYENNKDTNQYVAWRGMMRRCYDKKQLERYPTYKDCLVSKEWHCFQTFAKWYDENYYIIEGERIELDKDILIKGNKVYSPETCVFVPHSINILFIKSNAIRGDLPIGVQIHKATKKYIANCTEKGEKVYIGYYNTLEEAFSKYKKYKEKLIKQTAEDYKNLIPINLYKTMLSYTVDITD